MQENLPIPEETTDQEILIRCKTFRDALSLAREKAGKSEDLIVYELNRMGYKIDKTTLSLALSSNPSQKKNFPTEALDSFVEITNDIPLRYLALRQGYGLFKLKSSLELENETLKSQLEEKERELEVLIKYKKAGVI